MAAWPVTGHEWAVDLLRHAVAGNRLSHAYLISGPPQVGKRTLALAFAQALLCERSGEAPCGICRTCRRIAEGRYPDLQIIAAERNTIQIEQVRALQSDAALSPLEGKYKVFIVREVERLTPPAGNALLKVLEEPPPHVIILLSCTRRDQVLPTILSRCQILALRALPERQIQQALQERWGVEPGRAALLARLSAGRLGWAVRAHGDPELWQDRAKHLDDLGALVAGGPLVRLNLAESLSRRPEGLGDVLGLWATWWRDVLLIQQGAPEAIVNLDRRAGLEEHASRYNLEQVEAALVDLLATARRIRSNVHARLALEVLSLRLPSPGQS